MAVTSIWPIKGRVEDVIKYAKNPEKTRGDNLERIAASMSLKGDLSKDKSPLHKR